MSDPLSEQEKQELVFGIHNDEAQDAYANWTEEDAITTAHAMQIELSDKHWDVIAFLRLHYRNNGQVLPARELAGELDKQFSDQGGLRQLYQLFPGGPINQGCRIAGVPVPHHATDASFGSLM